MLKKITFCFLAVLLICSFTIFACAAQYQFQLSDVILLDFNNLIEGSSLWYSGVVTYSFSNPMYGDNGLVDGIGARITFDSTSIFITKVEIQTEFGWSEPDFVDLTSYGGICTVQAPDDIDYNQAVDMFITVFGSQAYAGTPPVYGGLFETFSTVFGWVVGVLVTIVSLFWANGSLTFFGICAIVALGIGLFLLIAHVISNFLQFRS